MEETKEKGFKKSLINLRSYEYSSYSHLIHRYKKTLKFKKIGIRYNSVTPKTPLLHIITL